MQAYTSRHNPAQSVNPQREPSLEDRISRAVLEAELFASAADDLDRALRRIVEDECPDDVRDAVEAIQLNLNVTCLDDFVDQVEALESLSF